MARAFQANAFQQTPGHVAFQSGEVVIGPPPVGPAGGGGVRMFTRKKWRELVELIAAEEAVVAKAAKVGSPARAAALGEAAEKAREAAAALEAVEYRQAFEADMARLTAMLQASAAARRVAKSIQDAQAAAALAIELHRRAEAAAQEDEEEIALLLDGW